MSTPTIPAQVPQAYREFLALVADVRPELHRYCARMTGSIADGEDVVQDTLAKTFYALGMLEELPALRPWLFRVAHNAAIDFTRRHQRSPVELVAELPEIPDADEGVDPETVRAALATFLTLPPLQRSAVILKDVVGHSGAEIAKTLGTTVPAVKAALVRGRERLRQERARGGGDTPPANDAGPRSSAALEEYVRLFNAGDWDGVRALLAEEVRLDLVSIATRKGKAVGVYFGRYAAEPDVRIAAGTLEGRAVLWVFVPRTQRAPEVLHRAPAKWRRRHLDPRLSLRPLHRERARADTPPHRLRACEVAPFSLDFEGLRENRPRDRILSDPPFVFQGMTLETTGRASKTKTAFRMECAVAINIRAKPETIWALLTDAADFPRWNSTVKSIEGEIAQGQQARGARGRGARPGLQAQGDRARAGGAHGVERRRRPDVQGSAHLLARAARRWVDGLLDGRSL